MFASFPTKLSEDVIPLLERAGQPIVQGRVATVEEIANAVFWLSSTRRASSPAASSPSTAASSPNNYK